MRRLEARLKIILQKVIRSIFRPRRSVGKIFINYIMYLSTHNRRRERYYYQGLRIFNSRRHKGIDQRILIKCECKGFYSARRVFVIRIDSLVRVGKHVTGGPRCDGPWVLLLQALGQYYSAERARRLAKKGHVRMRQSEARGHQHTTSLRTNTFATRNPR